MITDYTNFFLALLGASAALFGFLFVGVSLNLKKILSLPGLMNTALVAMLLLLAIFTVCSLMLTPNQTIAANGVMVLIIGIINCFIATVTGIGSIKLAAKTVKLRFIISFVYNEIAILPYLFAGIMFLKGNVAGYYWLAAAIILSIIFAVIDAWVLLVEINR